MHPGYVDLQVNGYAGVDFNQEDLSDEQLHAACERLREDGVAGVLATIITAPFAKMLDSLSRITALRRQDPLVEEIIWGFHIEGPFLNETPGYVGAHPASEVRPANIDDAKRLVDASDGLAKLVTLAPERDPGYQTTRWLADQKVLVAAGHCDSSVDELRNAIDAGLTLFTHLGNGCPMTLNRHDNIIQRALSLRDRLTLCFIADGMHIPLVALGNYLDLAGTDRTILVTDAISAARLGPGRYTLSGQVVDIGEDLAAWAPDHTHFVGSTATMPRMASLLRNQLKLSDETIKKLVCGNPRKALGMVLEVGQVPRT
jgi:N-acetylglucosamine-6-phosphate deacetylase